jgi:hypothetical protein
MSEQLRLRGDTAANVAAYTGPSRETVVDTTNNRLVVQDGITPGGWPAAKLAEVPRIARTAITASYSATPTDRLIAVTAIVSPITITLPVAATFQPGARLLVIDESGACSFSKSIAVVPQGTDVLVGVFSNTITTALGYLELESNGAGQWTMSDGLMAGTTTAGTVAPGSTAGVTTSGMPFSGQALIGVQKTVFAATIAEPRLKAGMRPIISLVNPLLLTKGLTVDASIVSFAPGFISIGGVVFMIDGRPAPDGVARLLLTLNYIGV